VVPPVFGEPEAFGGVATRLPYLHVYALLNEQARYERPPEAGALRRGTASSVKLVKRVLEALGSDQEDRRWMPNPSKGGAASRPVDRLLFGAYDGCDRQHHSRHLRSFRGMTRCVYGYLTKANWRWRLGLKASALWV
jgi:hypothetical protein